MPGPGIFLITGDDTLVIDTQTIATLADGGVVDLTRPNNLATGKVGKSGNGIVAINKTGFMADIKIRVMMGNADDNFLLNLLNQWVNAPTTFILMTGTFTKNLGDGKGNSNPVTYTLAGGYFLKDTPMVSNVEGNTDQAVAVYETQWLYAIRSIG
jgi:hypothetical protein